MCPRNMSRAVRQAVKEAKETSMAIEKRAMRVSNSDKSFELGDAWACWLLHFADMFATHTGPGGQR